MHKLTWFPSASAPLALVSFLCHFLMLCCSQSKSCSDISAHSLNSTATYHLITHSTILFYPKVFIAVIPLSISPTFTLTITFVFIVFTVMFVSIMFVILVVFVFTAFVTSHGLGFLKPKVSLEPVHSSLFFLAVDTAFCSL